MTDRDQFDALLRTHRVIPVRRTLFADFETPVALFEKVAADAGSFLLESAEQGGIFSRYSFVGARSFGVLTHDGSSSRWIDYGLSQDRAFGKDFTSPLEDAAHMHARWTGEPITGLPPLTGGLVGYIGWDAIREIETLPDSPPSDFPFARQSLAFVADMIAIDHRTGQLHLIASALNDGVETADEVYADAIQRLDSLEAALRRPTHPRVHRDFVVASPQAARRTHSDEFISAVETSKRHIRDGDVFQVVISQRFDAPSTSDPLDVYRVLRALNPSPYMYIIRGEDVSGDRFDIVGASPEALVRVNGKRVFTHPIAGSRPRGAGPEEDAKLENDLLEDPKERSEHLMLVDLARNDLAKVCQPGSVEVTEFMRVERFSHIMHLVSSVEGELRDHVGPLDVFRATFPAGTLSGAPKPRALQIIDELEPAARGLYGGVVGYFDFAGNTDLAIAIRTAYIRDGIARVQAGAGIVADSQPSLEDEEAHHKSAAMLRAIATAENLSS